MCKFFIVVLLLCCSACQQRTDVLLLQAESLIDSLPEVALQILKEKGKREQLDQHNKALYALLYTKALDKNALPIESDSLLQIALSYYETGSESIQLAESYYYLGCYFVEISMTQEAIQTFLKAEQIARSLNAWNLLGLIYGRLEGEYRSQQDWKNVLKMNRSALECFKNAHNLKNEYLSYLGLGQAFFYNNQIDSCRYYIQKSQEGFRAINDSLHYANALVTESNICLYYKDLKQAKRLVLKAKELLKNEINARVFITLAIIYKKESKLDSARKVVTHILRSDDNFNDPGLYFLLHEIEKLAGDESAALKTLRKSYFLQDSLYKSNVRNSVYRYAQLYNKKQADAEKQHLSFRNYVLKVEIGFLSVLLLLVYFVYKNRFNRHKREIAEARMRVLEAENRISKFQCQLQALEKVSDRNVRTFFLKQIQMLKELMEANTRNVHNEKKRNEEIVRIRGKYMLGEDWDALKTAANILYHGIADYLENRYKEELSENGIKICVLVCCGFSILEIATYLKISGKTVYNIRSEICKKLAPQCKMSLEQILDRMRQELVVS